VSNAKISTTSQDYYHVVVSLKIFIINSFQNDKNFYFADSLCNYCITVIIIENPIEFKCIHCKRIHQIPINGFPLNEHLNNRLIALEQVLNNEFTEIKKDIENKLKKTEFNITNGHYLIKEYSREVRTQVQLAKKLKIEQINNMSDDLIRKIDDFEKELLENYLSKQNHSQVMEYDLLNKEINEIKKGIKNLNNQIDLAKEMQSKLTLCHENLHKLLFNNRLIEFVHHTSQQDTIGQLSFGKFDEIDFKSLNRISFKSYIPECDLELSKDNSVFTCLSLNNDYFLFLIYQLKHRGTYDIKALLFDEKKAFKKSQLLGIEATCCRSAVVKSNCICFDYDHKRASYLYFMDYDLELINNICIDKQRLVGSNKSFIYLTNKDIDLSPISVYDWSFQLVKQIGQKINPIEPFHFPNYIYMFNNENGKYNLVDKQYLSIIDENTGHLDRSLRVYCVGLLGIDSENRLIVATDKKLMYLNQKGILLQEIKFLNHSDSELIWNLDKNNNLLIFNKKDNQLLIKNKLFFK